MALNTLQKNINQSVPFIGWVVIALFVFLVIEIVKLTISIGWIIATVLVSIVCFGILSAIFYFSFIKSKK